MRKITFPLFRKFILWLKKVLCIESNHEKAPSSDVTSKGKPVEEAGLPSEIVSPKTSSVEKKLVEPSLLEGKTIETTPLHEKLTPDKKDSSVANQPRMELPVVSKRESNIFEKQPREEILTEEQPQVSFKEIKPQTVSPTEEAKANKEDTQREAKNLLELQKPYKKKVFAEERKREPIKTPITEAKPSPPEQKEAIYLGDTQRRRRKITSTRQEFQSDEDIEKVVNNRTSEGKESADTIGPPFVEIDLDSAEVYLTLPQQCFNANPVDKTPQRLAYILDLNGKQQETSAKTVIGRGGLISVEEKRISLQEPLVKFQVVFPNEIQGREYNYNHNDRGFYVFVSRGNNHGRMYYLYDKDGKSNPLPKRVAWVLLHEEFELQTVLGSSGITDERWVWDKYKPFRIDLSEIDDLVIKNRISGEEKSFALQATFRVEGEQLVEDDFKKEFPLFTGKTLKITAPYENRSGWNVWIQNRVAGFKVKENWTGSKPLTLNCSEDLPCDCGEFQVDICQQDTRIPDETLFFRWMPYIELDYPKKLIVPDPKLGHFSSTINVKLGSNREWVLKYKEGQKLDPTQHNSYAIDLPSNEDALRFSIADLNKPESVVNLQITLPRLRWKTSEQEGWNDKPQEIQRSQLVYGEDLYLFIHTNDFGNQYDISATLEANNQQWGLAKFIRKGVDYLLRLNQFYDTIKHDKSKLTLEVKLHNVNDTQSLGPVRTFYFEGTPKVSEKILHPVSREKKTSQIPRIQALVKCSGNAFAGRKGKGFSREEVTGAKINLKDVRRLDIPYDRRRRSTHPSNINTLKGKYGNYGRR